ncbi:hypothetical protein R1sor_006358 [Riccia sorocarpa]|uniref:CCHC-type domain-containing protein n=1 Tax=Riccia sorocarpa TaxID=122646 RepID=A0ABD3HQ65_9MARC
MAEMESNADEPEEEEDQENEEEMGSDHGGQSDQDPEGEADESASLSPEEESRDICQRHPVWAQIVAENLDRAKRNPAKTQPPPDIDFDIWELLEAVEDIIDTTSPTGDNGDILVLDSKRLVAKVRKLKKQSFIIHTVDMWVTMDYFERWAAEIITRKLGVPIEGIIQVSKFCFQITVNSANSRNHVFANSPLFMGNKMVFCLPWDTRFTPDDLRSRMIPVWVELRDVKTCLMEFALEMLQKVGPVLYAAKNVETGKSNIIRGCIMVDLNKELKDVIKMVVPEAPDRIMRQAVRYTKLPDACFICRERGHFARACPTVQKQEELAEAQQAFQPRRNNRPEGNIGNGGRGNIPPTNQGRRVNMRGGRQEQQNDEGFRRVRGRSRRRFQEPERQVNMKVDNRFGVLQDLSDEEPEEQESEAEELPARNEHTDRIRTPSPSGPRSRSNNTVHSTAVPRQSHLDQQQQNTSKFQQDGILGVKHVMDSPNRRLSTSAARTLDVNNGRKRYKQIQTASADNDKEGTSKNTEEAADAQHPDRVRMLRARLDEFHKEVDILGFQELKAKQFDTERLLRRIAMGGSYVADYASNNWCNSALVCKPNVTVLDSGTKGEGYGTWVRISSARGEIGVVNLYVPHEAEKRRSVWS